MNRGGFSWRRLLGITAVKQHISRQIGIPLTRSGRQRKVGEILFGKGCLLSIAAFALLITSAVFIYLDS